eukprot:CAMPEP_0113707956 /NCGR_PEP_ID=MMETSP0038_2-20120614/28701_1 /TAXON_ID=2898 /ORGANISM="Cryptomonas paramecium" /LENGTH=268 /DNA_ID=CAMNT_0000633583 /DNA_START=89 /DNA_END=895 /DNA_ORIENTATION=- /assembly_acc=CAM_ASM_000170
MRSKSISKYSLFSWSAMPEAKGAGRFGLYLSHVVEPLLKDSSTEVIARAILPYKDLKDALYNIDVRCSDEKRDDNDLGSCAICLGDFGSRSEVVHTRCKHAFHGTCLASHLRMTSANRTVCCPMCRAPHSDLLPVGHDGAVLDFTLMFWDAIQSAEKIQNKLTQILETKLSSLRAQETKLWSIEKVVGTRRQRTIDKQLNSLLQIAQAAQFIAEVNAVGFRRILGKFQLRATESVSAEFFRQKISSCSFTKDFEEGGRLHLMLDELLI